MLPVAGGDNSSASGTIALMVNRFLFLTVLLCLCACGSLQSTARLEGTTGAATVTPPEADQPQTRIVYAEKYPGTDVGMKINAADAALGAAAGEIRVASGGQISTQINISSLHTLRFTGGTYTATTNSSVIRLKDNSALECSNWEVILQESTGKVGASSPFSIVRDYNGDVSNHAASQNITIRGCHFKGARSDFNSVPQTIGIGNCKNCEVTNNWLDATRTIGIQAGGGSAEGFYASNVLIARNLLTEVASQNIAVTNGDSVVIDANIMRKPGQLGGPGVSVIDVEPNSGDRLQNIRISNNRIDATLSTTFTVTNGIAVQNYNTTNYGPVEVVGNTLLGATHSTPRNDYFVYSGIIVNNAPNVRLKNNYIQRAPWGIKINGGSNGFVIFGNELSSCGSGSTYAINIIDASRGLVANNFLHEGLNDQVSVGITAVQIVENTLGGPIKENSYSNNYGAVYHLLKTGGSLSADATRALAAMGTRFAELATATDGKIVYCSDCKPPETCTASTTGSWVKRQNERWEMQPTCPPPKK